jgi:hypothetical protein
MWDKVVRAVIGHTWHTVHLFLFMSFCVLEDITIMFKNLVMYITLFYMKILGHRFVEVVFHIIFAKI